jgi:folate-binding protein YgfZ
MTTPLSARVPRDLVIVRGPDATSFLQSLVSQDLEPVRVGESARALLLQPQGKLLVDLYALRRDADEWWCVCEGGFGDVLAEGFNRFKIRVKVDIERAAVAALAVRGLEPTVDDPELAVIPVEWGGTPAVDVIGPVDRIDALAAALDVPLVDDGDYERARIEQGVPRQGFDVDERTIPQEAGLERTAVSFTKGCFVGQELVCRIDTRGHVNRVLRRVRASGSPILLGADVVASGKSVGTITSTAGDVGLALLRREVEPGTAVDVAGVSAAVEAVAPA